MKRFIVKVRIPAWVEKTIYIDDATSKTDATKKAKAWGKGEYDPFDFSGDENFGDDCSKLKVMNVEEE